jgi:serine/threonine-protein kinase
MIGQTLGSFKIEAELGAGAMGVVYRGVSTNTGKTAAIKVISKEATARGGKAFERFIREIDLLEQFRHPNIVRYMARGRYQGIYYYAMEYVPGGTLDDLIKKTGPIPWKDVVKYGIQICSALEYAHEKSVIHRDLKPSNLMVGKDGQLKLTDFGIAKDLDATALTAAGRTLGTAAYMAPEQITGASEITHKIDLYALGVVLFELLTGEPPFKGETIAVLMHRHMTEPAPRPSSRTEEIPVALDQLVVKLLEKLPSNRPHDAAFVGMKLQEILDKADRGEKIPMVWPEGGSQNINPTRDYMTASSKKEADAATTPRKKRAKAGSAGDRRRIVEHLPLIGQILALVLIAVLIGYFVWPPGADYLFHNAERLMASDQRTDWLLAKEEYLDPLDQRFPNHPYRDKTSVWRDKISLSRAAGRAELLRKANTDAEEFYLSTLKEATVAIDRGDELDAAKRWRDMADKLADKGEEERGWALFARQKIETLEKGIAARKTTVADILTKADDFDKKGAADTATNLRRQAVEQYGKFTDVAELLAPARAKLPPEEKKQPDVKK